jgi:hypothetical protein
MMLTEHDKLLLRSWSAVMARGLDGADDVVTEMLKTKGIVITLADVERRLAGLRAMGQLP